MAKLYDKETQSIANVVSDVLEGKTKEEGYGKKKIKSGYGEDVKYPHDMYHPETGAKVVAKTEKDHEELSKKGYTHEKPVKEGPEEPRAQGEKEFKKKHVIKKSGENPDGTVTKEDTKASKSLKTHKIEKEPSNSKEVKEATLKVSAFTGKTDDGKQKGDGPDNAKKSLRSRVKIISKGESQYGGHNVIITGSEEDLIAYAKANLGADPDSKTLADVQRDVAESVKEEKRELTDEQKYKEFFASALKKYGVESPAELDKEKRKEFFNYVDKNYKATNEDVNEVLGTVKKVAKRAVNKVTGKSSKLRQDIKDLKLKIDDQKKKLERTRAKWKAAQDSGSDEAEDFHGGREMTQTQELEKMQDRMKELVKKLQGEG